MDKTLLVMEQIDAGTSLITEFNKTIPLQAAFWLMETDGGEWFLYLASDRINDSNADVAYGEVLRVTGGRPSLWLDPFQVKVINADDPLAQAALAIQQKYPGKLPTRYRGRQFGGLSVEEVYIYPLPLTATA